METEPVSVYDHVTVPILFAQNSVKTLCQCRCVHRESHVDWPGFQLGFSAVKIQVVPHGEHSVLPLQRSTG